MALAATAFEALFSACHAGVAVGWMCDREGEGIRYGRVIEQVIWSHDDLQDCVVIGVPDDK